MPIMSIDAATLKRWLESGEAVVVDVREPGEYEAECIEGAALVPLATICKQRLPIASGKKLVVHCRSGKRGASACEKLLAEDPALEIYHLEGGLSAWEQAGFEVKRSGKFFLPLDRQVQLTIGLCVLLGSLLTYFVNPLFVLLTGFFGAGLTFAGLSGFCGLAMVMAKMPWNRGTGQRTSCCIKS
ncbi:MAG TPA: rhodanese-like domain-containing protein [Rickettsiales bacterium]|nr:rhodanese-like domain-containing protein [Rickettsiales bacterium]